MSDKSNLPLILTNGTLQIYFDQMNHIHTHLKEITQCRPKSKKNKHDGQQLLHMEQVHHIHSILEEMIPSLHEEMKAIVNRANIGKLRQRELIKSKDWKEWESCKWKQLNQYQEQHMFGGP